jgi:acetyl-CoA/propionyl-CoA carboxylase biotin carboxyl carrier protein
MGEQAVALAKAVNYDSAGTVEFVAGQDKSFYFLEMNTRLQVEHPVTELVTGIDLVEEQLKAAAGDVLSLTQNDVKLTGHAIEARVYAEDPANGFLPTGGRTLLVREPSGEHLRVDSSLARGGEVGVSYDPMLAKVIAWGNDRSEAIRLLDAGLAGTTVLGLATNIAFQRALLAHPDVRAGRLDTGLIERHLDELTASTRPDDVLAAFAVMRHLTARAACIGPWDAATSWRPAGPAWTTWNVNVSGKPHTISARPSGARTDALTVSCGESISIQVVGTLRGDELELTIGDRTTTFLTAGDDPVWLGREGAAWSVTCTPRQLRQDAAGVHDGGVLSPMPGSVVAVHLAVGDSVTAGQPLLVVEAMKMEHTLTAPHDGVVTQVHARLGQQVAVGAPLVDVKATADDGSSRETKT